MPSGCKGLQETVRPTNQIKGAEQIYEKYAGASFLRAKQRPMVESFLRNVCSGIENVDQKFGFVHACALL